MSREIKFRAFNKNEKKMYNVFSFCDTFVKVEVLNGTSSYKTPSNLFYPLMQFTEETNHKDLKIFQGDILECENGRIYFVDFRKGSWIVVHAPTCGSERDGSTECKWDYLHDFLKHIKVDIVGNEYENPELLN